MLVFFFRTVFSYFSFLYFSQRRNRRWASLKPPVRYDSTEIDQNCGSPNRRLSSIKAPIRHEPPGINQVSGSPKPATKEGIPILPTPLSIEQRHSGRRRLDTIIITQLSNPVPAELAAGISTHDAIIDAGVNFYRIFKTNSLSFKILKQKAHIVCNIRICILAINESDTSEDILLSQMNNGSPNAQGEEDA